MNLLRYHEEKRTKELFNHLRIEETTLKPIRFNEEFISLKAVKPK